MYSVFPSQKGPISQYQWPMTNIYCIIKTIFILFIHKKVTPTPQLLCPRLAKHAKLLERYARLIEPSYSHGTTTGRVSAPRSDNRIGYHTFAQKEANRRRSAEKHLSSPYKPINKSSSHYPSPRDVTRGKDVIYTRAYRRADLPRSRGCITHCPLNCPSTRGVIACFNNPTLRDGNRPRRLGLRKLARARRAPDAFVCFIWKAKTRAARNYMREE